MIGYVVVGGSDGGWDGWTSGYREVYVVGSEFTKNCLTDMGIWRGLKTVFLLSVDNKSVNALLASLKGSINLLANWGASEQQKL